MKTSLILFFISLVFSSFGQNQTVTNDTIYNSEDSVVVFATVKLDSFITCQYYGAYTEYEYSTYRYGFLWLKKRTWRLRPISHVWDEKYYTEWHKYYPGLRICLSRPEVIYLPAVE